MTAALRPLPGVHAVGVDVPAKTVTVHADTGFSVEAARAAIDDAGYDVTAVTEQAP